MKAWTPARALAWEYARLAWAQVLGTVIASCALAALFHYSLEGLGERRDRISFIGLLAMLLVINVATLMNCREGGLGLRFERRLFRLPLPTWKLVAGRMLPAMAAASFMVIVVNGFMRVVAEADWPIITPWLLTLAGLCWVMALGWAFGRTPLLFMPAMVPSAVLAAAWLQPRLETEDSLRTLSPTDMAIVAGVIVASAVVAVLGVSRDRSGDSGAPVGSSANTRRFGFGRRAAAGASARQQADQGAVLAPIGSPLWAQLWMEWREKGWILPAAAVGGVATNAILGLIVGVDTERALRSMAAYPFFGALLLPPVIGFLFGRFSLSSEITGIDSFRARRPMSDRQLAWTFLGAATLTMVITWVAGGVAIAATLFGLRLLGDAALVEAAVGGLLGAFLSLPPETIAYTVVGLGGLAWTMMGLALAINLTGRGWVSQVLAAGPYGLVMLGAAGQRIFRVDVLPTVLPVVAVIAVIAAPLATFAVMWTVLRRRLVGLGVVAALVVAWVAVLALMGLRMGPVLETLVAADLGALERVLSLGVPAAASLPLLPILAAPLALSWNRHR